MHDIAMTALSVFLQPLAFLAPAPTCEACRSACMEHLRAFGPLAGGRPALPGGRPPTASTCLGRRKMRIAGA